MAGVWLGGCHQLSCLKCRGTLGAASILVVNLWLMAMQREARAKDVTIAYESPCEAAGRVGGGRLHRRCWSQAFFLHVLYKVVMWNCIEAASFAVHSCVFLT